MGNEIFKKREKELREKNNMTMEQLAEKLGITKSRVNMWENTGTVPRQDVLIKLSQLYGVSADFLLGNTIEGTDPNKPTLNRIQRGLNKMDNAQLDQAEKVLEAIFKDVFED